MITIVDYGMGNLRSVQKAVEYLGGTAQITDNPSIIKSAQKLILPGVGAFAQAMDNLRSKGLIESIMTYIQEQKPFLGICLGMQLLLETSQEHGYWQGLGVIKGSVELFNTGLSVPQIGWNTVRKTKESELFNGLPFEFQVYFVHSYFVKPLDNSVVIGETDYGINYCSALQQGNIYGVQFHPEKSGEVGLRILKNFLHL